MHLNLPPLSFIHLAHWTLHWTFISATSSIYFSFQKRGKKTDKQIFNNFFSVFNGYYTVRRSNENNAKFTVSFIWKPTKKKPKKTNIIKWATTFYRLLLWWCCTVGLLVIYCVVPKFLMTVWWYLKTHTHTKLLNT